MSRIDPDPTHDTDHPKMETWTRSIVRVRGALCARQPAIIGSDGVLSVLGSAPGTPLIAVGVIVHYYGDERCKVAWYPRPDAPYGTIEEARERSGW